MPGRRAAQLRKKVFTHGAVDAAVLERDHGLVHPPRGVPDRTPDQAAGDAAKIVMDRQRMGVFINGSARS